MTGLAVPSGLRCMSGEQIQTCVRELDTLHP